MTSQLPLKPWIQVLTPSCHYTATYPSAVATVAYEMSRCHLAHHGEVKVVVHQGARHDYPAGDCLEVPFGAPVTSAQKLADATAALAGAPRPFGARQYRGVVDALRGSQSVILVHNGPVALAALKKACPAALVCLWAHNEFWRTYSRREMKSLVAASDRLICVSHYMADTLRERLGGDSEKIRVVNNGVDIERFTPAASPPQNQEPVIAFVGRVSQRKGPHLLIEAARLLDDGQRRFKIRIVGGVKAQSLDGLPPYQRELRALAAPLGAKIEFVDSVDRLRVVEEYQKTDVFCAPSIWNDPCPLTILEGMACGLATVTTKRGGIAEMAADSALYFDPDRPDSLAQLLSRLLDDAAERRHWAQKARARAEAMSWDQQYQVLIQALA